MKIDAPSWEPYARSPTDNRERIRQALQHIDPTDRDTWVQVGMAVKSELADDGRDIWMTWSQQADSFNQKDASDVWRSIDPAGRVTIATLFHHAKQSGWRDDGTYQAPTPQELAEREQARQERQAKSDAENAAQREQTAHWASAIFRAASPAGPDHPYLERKQVTSTATLKEIDIKRAVEILGYAPKAKGQPLAGRLLVVPVMQDGKLSTLELIDEAGHKTALPGNGTKSGGYWATERLPGSDGSGMAIAIGEGVATVLSASQAAGCTGIAALSSSNLPSVTRAMRDRFPKAVLIVLADLKKDTGEPDPGAVKAAQETGCRLAVPDFGPGREPGQTDFNDLAVSLGAEAVKTQVHDAKAIADERPAQGYAWPEMRPIPSGLLPVEPFDYDLLPSKLRAWVRDIAERMQCPPDFPSVGAMVALSSVIGRKAVILPKQRDDWTVTPNLWGCIVGRPGVMKSPALSEVLKPLTRLDLEAHKAFTAAKADYDVRIKLAELEEKAATAAAAKLLKDKKSGDAFGVMKAAHEALNTVEPVARRYQVTDATVQALGEILIENPWGVLVYRDELHSLLKSLDKEGQEEARGFYLQAFDGNQSYTIDRIGRGKNLRVPHACIALLGGIQPGKLQRYIYDATTGGTGDDGLIQRFGMLVWPDGRSGDWVNVDEWADKQAKNQAFETFVRLDQLPTGIGDDGEPAPVRYRFSAEAQLVFNDWRKELESVDLRRDDASPAMESHLSKYRKLVPALALVCALADGDYDRDNRIGEESLSRAILWSVYLRSHAERAYAAGSMPSTDGAKLLLSKIKKGLLPSPFKPADVYLKGWAGLNDVKLVHQSADMLDYLGYLQRIEIPTTARGGRPSVVYLVRPELLEVGHG